MSGAWAAHRGGGRSASAAAAARSQARVMADGRACAGAGGVAGAGGGAGGGGAAAAAAAAAATAGGGGGGGAACAAAAGTGGAVGRQMVAGAAHKVHTLAAMTRAGPTRSSTRAAMSVRMGVWVVLLDSSVYVRGLDVVVVCAHESTGAVG